jgi:post-segregation antitoxin (ccd killing protein)
MISVRVKKSLREEAERLGINIREVEEKALEEEIRKVKMERLKKFINLKPRCSRLGGGKDF